MNACGHHHVGHIGILGVDKHGKEWYQITIGGSPAGPASLGEVIGPSVPKDQVAETISKLLEVYVRERHGDGELFLHTVRRIGIEPFRERVYETDHSAA
jgi:sulfite reductase (NADPH) hemoprotein beta-component